MSDELKIIIGADVGNFQAGVNNVVKSIGQLEAELKQFEKDIKTLKGDEFTAMSGKIDGLKTSIASLKSVGSSTLPKLGEDAAKAAAGIDKLAKPAGNADLRALLRSLNRLKQLQTLHFFGLLLILKSYHLIRFV